MRIDKVKITDGHKRSSLTIQEVYDKMNYQFLEGLRLGREENENKRKEEEEKIVKVTRDVEEFIKSHKDMPIHMIDLSILMKILLPLKEKAK